jgi:predicted O-linked N-acetylglucosamine transferase (SPINDLY family)
MNESLLRTAFRLHQDGDIEQAARLCGEILRLDPGQVDALYLLGFIHFQRGQAAEAARHFDSALAIAPHRYDVLAARGATLSNLNRHLEALADYDKTVALRPGHAHAWNNRGNALLELGRNADALASYDKAIANKPDYADAWRNRGIALSQLNRADEAVASFDRALALQPSHPGALEDRAYALMRLARHEEALSAFGKALALKPNDPDLLYNRANCLSILKRFEEAMRDCEQALAIAPDYPYARGVLIHCKLNCCDWRGLDKQKARVASGLTRGLRVVSPFNHKALSDSAAEQLQCAKNWVAHECPPSSDPLWRGEPYHHDRIRLAYVSADFGHTAVGTLMAGVFEQHDHSRFETIAISFGGDDGTPTRARLAHAFEHFIDLRAESDAAIAQRMRQVEIDIAVDLMGFTGACRSGILARRPAPLQVNYLGFPGTMGAPPYIDYIIADRIVVPDEHLPFFSEQVVHLPHTYLPGDGGRGISTRKPSRRENGLPEKGFVFCSFNNAYKFSPEMFDVWMRLLASVEGSVLWLPRNNPVAMHNLAREAVARGVSADRLVFAPQVPASDEYLARFALADLFLDTLPYNAHSTAADALWAGLPLLTCTGHSFAGRVGASLLAAVGLPELVTETLPAYEAMALSLASDPGRLAAIRARLFHNRANAPPFDTVRFTLALETAYSTMWQRHQQGLQPARFAVES